MIARLPLRQRRLTKSSSWTTNAFKLSDESTLANREHGVQGAGVGVDRCKEQDRGPLKDTDRARPEPVRGIYQGVQR